jgi:hypothetical protein
MRGPLSSMLRGHSLPGSEIYEWRVELHRRIQLVERLDDEGLYRNSYRSRRTEKARRIKSHLELVPRIYASRGQERQRTPERCERLSLLLLDSRSCHLKVRIRLACPGEEFLQRLLGECRRGHDCGYAQDCWQELRHNIATQSQGAAFLTLSVIARSSMEHGQCIDYAEAIEQRLCPGAIDSLKLVKRSPCID